MLELEMGLISCHPYMISVINKSSLKVGMVLINIEMPMRIIVIILTMAMWKESDAVDVLYFHIFNKLVKIVLLLRLSSISLTYCKYASIFILVSYQLSSCLIHHSRNMLILALMDATPRLVAHSHTLFDGHILLVLH